LSVFLLLPIARCPLLALKYRVGFKIGTRRDTARAKTLERKIDLEKATRTPTTRVVATYD
jgi:hypothetical protein